ncbi:MAG: MFS transporter, partial [Oceanibaculum sp.]
MPLSARLGPVGRALSHPNYRLYVTGNMASLIGTWMQRIGIGWVAWELTGSAAWLGIVAFADLFPT